MNDSANSQSSEAPGLPPVIAPSGRFIAQLFLVPGLIVAGAVTVLLGFSWLAGGNRTPAAFLDALESGNADIRWRTASDLAQVLKRDTTLASDPDFGLKLAVLLKKALDDLDRSEAGQSRTDAASDKALEEERRQMLTRRSSVQYLCACLGSLLTPAGAPVLADLAHRPPGRDPKTDALLRRQSVWALAALGDNLGKFSTLPEERRTTVIAGFEAAIGQPGDAGKWARQAVGYYRKTDPLGVIDALAVCGKDDDPFIRKQTALALAFWLGTDEENKRADAALVTLARDDGHGTSIAIAEKD